MENNRQIAKIPKVRERRTKVMEMLLSGLSRHQITLEIREEYGIGQKSVDKDITQAYSLIKLNHDTEVPDLIAKHIGMYYEVWQDAKVADDYKSCIAAQQAIEKLLKLHNPENATFVQNNTYSFDNLSLEEAKQLLIDSKKDD